MGVGRFALSYFPRLWESLQYKRNSLALIEKTNFVECKTIPKPQQQKPLFWANLRFKRVLRLRLNKYPQTRQNAHKTNNNKLKRQNNGYNKDFENHSTE